MPGGSEALLLYYKSENYAPYLLLIVATAGNTLGSLVNYYLGRYALEWAFKKKYMKSSQVDMGKRYFQKYGAFALLLSWTPVIGDPITFVAGVLSYSLKKFIFLVLIAKLLRYSFLLYFYDIIFTT